LEGVPTAEWKIRQKSKRDMRKRGQRELTGKKRKEMRGRRRTFSDFRENTWESEVCVFEPHRHSVATVAEWDVNGCDVRDRQLDARRQHEIEGGKMRQEEGAEVVHLIGHAIGSRHRHREGEREKERKRERKREKRTVCLIQSESATCKEIMD
jgi:hypothetical protein